MATVRSRSAATRAVTLDLMLRTFMNSSEFVKMEPKNWEAVARLIPGTTAKQCESKWEELSASSSGPRRGMDGLSAQGRPFSSHSQTRQMTKYVKSMLNDPKTGGGRGAQSNQGVLEDKAAKISDDDDLRSPRKLTLTQRSAFSDQLTASTGFSGEEVQAKDLKENAILVIHVRDEAKNLQRDFSCPKDLLLSEMRYFNDYKFDPQHLVDISVHCDIYVFDWLMRYVKHRHSEDVQMPKMEANNAVSLLIASNFLQMDFLVEQCLSYIHDNVSRVINTPCNMGCVADSLMTRLVGLFSLSEVEAVRDRKEKLKSKLYFKMLAELFQPDCRPEVSPSNGSTLFHCTNCGRLLTQETQWRIKCSASSVKVGHRGTLLYCHERDTTWDPNDYLISLRNQGMNWRQICWRIWSLVNHLECFCCKQTFPCAEYSRCAYHPEEAAFDASLSPTIGYYPCCGKQAIKFDAWENQEGCTFRDHDVVTAHSKSSETVAAILKDVQTHRDLVCLLPSDLRRGSSARLWSDSCLTIFKADEVACGIDQDRRTPVESRSSRSVSIVRCTSHSQDAFSFSETDDRDLGQEDEEEEEEKPQVRASRKSQIEITKEKTRHRPSSRQPKSKSGVWNVNRSKRWNADSQREHERRKFKNLIVSLTTSADNAPGQEKPKNKEVLSIALSQTPSAKHPGGIFCHLEDKWRAQFMTVKSRRKAVLPKA